MEIEQITVPKEEIEVEYNALREALKQNAQLQKTQIHQDLHQAYKHLKHGKAIIDVFQSFKTAGLNEDGDPKLALCRADGDTCHGHKFVNGGMLLGINPYDSWSRRGRKTLGDVHIPANTFQWRREDPDKGLNRWNLLRGEIKTLVPLIPARILVKAVKHHLRNYYILWEAESWNEIPGDPMLLKRLTPNLFGVLATWNLTKLEKAVIRGRIA